MVRINGKPVTTPGGVQRTASILRSIFGDMPDRFGRAIGRHVTKEGEKIQRDIDEKGIVRGVGGGFVRNIKEGAKGTANLGFDVSTGIGELLTKGFKGVAKMSGDEAAEKVFQQLDDDFDTFQKTVREGRILARDENVPLSAVSRFAGEFMLPFGAAENIALKAARNFSQGGRFSASVGSDLALTIPRHQANEEESLAIDFAAAIGGGLLARGVAPAAEAVVQGGERGAQLAADLGREVFVENPKVGGFVRISSFGDGGELPKELEALAADAKKFDSVEEFVADHRTEGLARIITGGGERKFLGDTQNLKEALRILQKNGFEDLQDFFNKVKSEKTLKEVADEAEGISKKLNEVSQSNYAKPFEKLSANQAEKVIEISDLVVPHSDEVFQRISKASFDKRFIMGDSPRSKSLRKLAINEGKITDSYFLIDDKNISKKLLDDLIEKNALSQAKKIKARGDSRSVLDIKQGLSSDLRKLDGVDPIDTKPIIDDALKNEGGELVPQGYFVPKDGSSGSVVASFSDGKNQVMINPDYVRLMKKHFPRARFYFSGKGSPVVVRQRGNFKGLLMPTRGESRLAPDFFPRNELPQKGSSTRNQQTGASVSASRRTASKKQTKVTAKQGLRKEGKNAQSKQPPEKAPKTKETRQSSPSKVLQRGISRVGETKTAAPSQENMSRKSRETKQSESVTNLSRVEDGVFRAQLQESKIPATSKTGELSLGLKKDMADLIKKQSEKITDKKIREIRNKSLLGEETLSEIILRKRGIITDKEALERAAQLKITTKDILNLPKGTTLNKEQITAVRQVLANEREINKNLRAFVESGAGLDRKTREFIDKVSVGRQFDSMTDEQLLIKALEDSTIKLKQLEIVNLAIGSEAGRALQALKQNVPAVDMRMRAIWSRMKKKTKLEQEAIAERLAKTNIDDPKEFIDFLDSLESPGFWEKFAEASTAAKLWMPTTHLVNFFGNTLRQSIDIGIKSVTNPRAVARDIAGIKNGLRMGVKNFLRALTDEGYAQQLSKYIEEGGRAPAIKGKLGKVARAPFRALGASDEIFRAVAFNRSMYRQTVGMSPRETKEFLSSPPLEAIEKATREAERMTFQEDMGEITRQINNFRDPINFKSFGGRMAAAITRLFLPFLKTPTNIFKQAIDFSPAGFLKNAKIIKKGGEEGRTAAAEAVAGTALVMYFVSLAEEGLITGAVPKNKKERDTFYLDKQPYSVKVGDKWYSYQRIDPIATTIGMAVDIKNNEENSVGELAGSFIDNLKDKTYLQGIRDLTDLLTGEGWERSRAFTNAFLGIFPNIFGGVARSIDPVIRDTKEGFGSKAKARVPFLSQTLPARYDVLGDELRRGQEGLEQFLNPIRESREVKDPDKKKVIEAFAENMYSVSLPYPSRSFSHNNAQIVMDAEQYETFSKDFGAEFKSLLLSYIDSDQYKKSTIENRVDKFDSLRKKAAEKAKKKIIKKNQGDNSQARKDLLRRARLLKRARELKNR